MVGENGVPETPDWFPVSRCCDGCPESAIPHHVFTSLRTVLRMPATWQDTGDQA